MHACVCARGVRCVWVEHARAHAFEGRCVACHVHSSAHARTMHDARGRAWCRRAVWRERGCMHARIRTRTCEMRACRERRGARFRLCMWIGTWHFCDLAHGWLAGATWQLLDPNTQNTQIQRHTQNMTRTHSHQTPEHPSRLVAISPAPSRPPRTHQPARAPAASAPLTPGIAARLSPRAVHTRACYTQLYPETHRHRLRRKRTTGYGALRRLTPTPTQLTGPQGPGAHARVVSAREIVPPRAGVEGGGGAGRARRACARCTADVVSDDVATLARSRLFADGRAASTAPLRLVRRQHVRRAAAAAASVRRPD